MQNLPEEILQTICYIAACSDTPTAVSLARVSRSMSYVALSQLYHHPYLYLPEQMFRFLDTMEASSKYRKYVRALSIELPSWVVSIPKAGDPCDSEDFEELGKKYEIEELDELYNRICATISNLSQHYHLYSLCLDATAATALDDMQVESSQFSLPHFQLGRIAMAGVNWSQTQVADFLSGREVIFYGCKHDWDFDARWMCVARIGYSKSCTPIASSQELSSFQNDFGTNPQQYYLVLVVGSLSDQKLFFRNLRKALYWREEAGLPSFSRIVIKVRPGATNYHAMQKKLDRLGSLLGHVELGIWDAYGSNQTEAERYDWLTGKWLDLSRNSLDLHAKEKDIEEWCKCNYNYPSYDTDSERGYDPSDPTLSAKHDALAQISDILEKP